MRKQFGTKAECESQRTAARGNKATLPHTIEYPVAYYAMLTHCGYACEYLCMAMNESDFYDYVLAFVCVHVLPCGVRTDRVTE